MATKKLMGVFDVDGTFLNNKLRGLKDIYNKRRKKWYKKMFLLGEKISWLAY